MKILLVGAAYSTFTFEFISQVLDEDDFDITIFNIGVIDKTVDAYDDYYNHNNVKIVFTNNSFRLVRIIKNYIKLKKLGNFDIAHIHYLASESSLIATLLSKKYKKIIATFYGSDLFRAGKLLRMVQKFFLKKVSCVTVATIEMKNSFETFFPSFNKDVDIVRLGASCVDTVLKIKNEFSKEECKKSFGLPENKIAVFCGYNSFEAHRQPDIINEISKLSSDDKNRIHIVCHCSYPKISDENYNRIDSAIKNSGCSGTIITEFLTGDKLAKLRCCCDVMFNLQKTDALSASMQENILAGGVVITGDWLHYSPMDNVGVYYEKIDCFDRIPDILTDIINNTEKYAEKVKGNEEKIYAISSWKPIKNDWLKIIRK